MRPLAAAFALLAFAGSAYAAPAGSPDPAFGTGGIARITYPGEVAAADTLLPSPAGLVIVGSSATTTSHDGKLILARLTPLGVRDAAFGSVTASGGATYQPAGAVIEPSGHIVVAATGTPGDRYPYRVRLFGFDAGGRPDASFGSGGSLLLSEPAAATTLLQQADGTLLVVGASSSSAGSLTQRVYLARVSADGHEHSSSIGAAGGADGISVTSALLLGDGSVLLAGDSSGPFLAHFAANGSFDASFGPRGLRRLGLHNVQIDSIALDAAGRVLVAGAHVGDLGRSVGVPIAALLLRTSVRGTIDRGFARGGRGVYLGGELELNGITPLPGGGVLASAADGSVLRFNAAGNPQLGFGVGGTSPSPAGAQLGTNGLLVSGSTAVLPGSVPAPHFGSRMAVERVLLTGSGVISPRRRDSVVLTPSRGQAMLRVPIAPQAKAFATPTAAPLTYENASIGDGAFETPRAALVGLPSGRVSVTVRGSGGTATLRGNGTMVGLRRGSGTSVALLELAAPSCARATLTTLTLHGQFSVAAGARLARNLTHNAELTVRQACHRPPEISVGSGRVSSRHRRPVAIGVSFPR